MDFRTEFIYENGKYMGYNLYTEKNYDPSTRIIEKRERIRYNNLDRIANVGDGNTTFAAYHYGADGNIVFDSVVNKDGTLHEMSYVFGANGVEGYCKDNSPDFYGYFVTARGDVSAVRDKDGNYNNYSYDAFGNDTGSDTAFTSPYRYTGQYYDEETDKYYLRARYYDASLGRFPQEDTYLGEDNAPFTLNLYTYCHNNPVMYTDPSGHFAKGDIIKVGRKNNKTDVKKFRKF